MSTYSREDSNLRDEHGVGPRSAEQTAELVRVPWSPTPLNPDAVRKDDELYLRASLETIEALIDKADKHAMENDIPARVHGLIEPSLITALFKRFENNSGKRLSSGHSEETKALFTKAEIGAANPHELIALLDQAPELEAVELSKMSHPYEWRVTRAMDEAVVDAVYDWNIQLLDEEPLSQPSHYFARADDHADPGAVVVVRKQNIGTIDGLHAPMHVVKRDSYIVDLKHPLMRRTQKECADWLAAIGKDEGLQDKFGGNKFKYDGEELSHAVESALTYDYHGGYLYPTVSSYYVHL